VPGPVGEGPVPAAVEEEIRVTGWYVLDQSDFGDDDEPGWPRQMNADVDTRVRRPDQAECKQHNDEYTHE
jgi:hypothetical protein